MITLVTPKEAKDLGVSLRYGRGTVLVVGDDLDDASVWAVAATAGAEHVIFMPDATPWLVERVTAMQEVSS